MDWCVRNSGSVRMEQSNWKIKEEQVRERKILKRENRERLSRETMREQLARMIHGRCGWAWKLVTCVMQMLPIMNQVYNRSINLLYWGRAGGWGESKREENLKMMGTNANGQCRGKKNIFIFYFPLCCTL